MTKDPQGRDNPPAPADYVQPWRDMGEYDNFLHVYDVGHPDVYEEVHREFRATLEENDGDRLAGGEMHVFDTPEWASYCGENLDQLQMPFNSHLIAAEWDAASVRGAVEAALGQTPDLGWTNGILGNHEMRSGWRPASERATPASPLSFSSLFAGPRSSTTVTSSACPRPRSHRGRAETRGARTSTA